MLMGLVWTIDGLVAQETDTFGVGNDLGFCRTPILCVKRIPSEMEVAPRYNC